MKSKCYCWTSFQSGEECDDGNAINGDGCDLLCKMEEFYSCKGNTIFKLVLLLILEHSDIRYKRLINTLG